MSEPALALDKIGFEQINLPDQSHRWAVIKTFSWTGAPDDADHLVDALRQHRSFRDHYCAPGEEGVGDEPPHGPYRLDAVTVGSFDRVTQANALRQLDEWLVESNSVNETPPTGDDVAVVENALRPVRDLLRKGGELLFLPYLGKEAEHEWGWVLWFFREWLVVDREGHQLYEVACGVD